jgi:hypothetical protein
MNGGRRVDHSVISIGNGREPHAPFAAARKRAQAPMGRGRVYGMGGIYIWFSDKRGNHRGGKNSRWSEAPNPHVDVMV